MENSIYTGLSFQVALRKKMDIISNNVANMTTPGYRNQNMVFLEYVNKPTASEGRTDPRDSLSMVLDYGHYQNTAPGSISVTNNPYDVALHGPGWFGIETPDGVQYSRAGNFTVNNLGELVTPSGNRVSSMEGGAIVIPADAREVMIAHDGTVSTEAGAVGRIMVVEFESDQTLEAAGNGLYIAPDAGVEAVNTQVKQGMLEGSNVNSVLEITRMIDVLRSYQSTQRMLQNEHERQQTMIQRLSRSQ